MKKIIFSSLILLFTFSLSAQSGLWNEMLFKHVSANGWVNYKGMQKEEAKLDKYLAYLNSTNIKGWSDTKRKAFWMNAYNAYTVKMILDYYPLKSIMDIKVKEKGAWDIPYAKVGGKLYTLNAIEHEILRPKFKDPRIHAGINCASYSCPPILNKAFTEANVNSLLELAMKNFVNDPIRNKISKDKIEISQLFDWFTSDFTDGDSVIDYLNKYSKTKISKSAKVTYLKYVWTLNEA